MSNPPLPDGAVNGTRFVPNADFAWPQPDDTVIQIYAGDTAEVRIEGSDVWLDVTYMPASVDKRVAIETARAESAEAALSAEITSSKLYAAAFATFMAG